jgi:hypothetical protein
LRVEYQRYVNAPRNSAANSPKTGYRQLRLRSGAAGLPAIATALRSHLGELGANMGTARTRRNFRQVANDPTFQEVDWHRLWKGEFGMPTTKVKKSKSK